MEVDLHSCWGASTVARVSTLFGRSSSRSSRAPRRDLTLGVCSSARRTSEQADGVASDSRVNNENKQQ